MRIKLKTIHSSLSKISVENMYKSQGFGVDGVGVGA
jgi:hypothetical protein